MPSPEAFYTGDIIVGYPPGAYNLAGTVRTRTALCVLHLLEKKKILYCWASLLARYTASFESENRPVEEVVLSVETVRHVRRRSHVIVCETPRPQQRQQGLSLVV